MKSDSAVLCTNEESFELKEAETSNSLLILPECEFTAQSLSCCSQPSAISRQVLLTSSLSTFYIHFVIHSFILKNGEIRMKIDLQMATISLFEWLNRCSRSRAWQWNKKNMSMSNFMSNLQVYKPQHVPCEKFTIHDIHSVNNLCIYKSQHVLASCQVNAWPLPANPLPVATSMEMGSECPFRCSFGCILLLNQLIWQQCTIRQYHSDLSDQSVLEIRVRIRVRLRVALF